MAFGIRHSAFGEEGEDRAQLSVRRLSLGHFRNYLDLRLELTAQPVVLFGPNGSGKTNILEAISLLVPGRGLRRARAVEWQNKDDPAPWGLSVELDTPAGALQIGTGRDASAPESDRRLVQIDGKSVKSQQALAGLVAMAWITPELDRVLVESPGARRKLVDRLAYSFDPAHVGRVQRYEKAMRERLRLLRDGMGDAAWFAALEDEMARTGVAIAAARRQLIGQLRAAMDMTASAFPQADLRLVGDAEEALDEKPALLVEDYLRDRLKRGRADDAAAGSTGAGPHRSDLAVVHKARGVTADLCSTGEQKALLIALMLAYVRVLTEARGMAPLLLLDDIAAHLDVTRRAALFDELASLGVQAWLTGTDKDLFAPFLPRVQAFAIDAGRVL